MTDKEEEYFIAKQSRIIERDGSAEMKRLSVNTYYCSNTVTFKGTSYCFEFNGRFNEEDNLSRFDVTYKKDK